jgi:hypothetical protein
MILQKGEEYASIIDNLVERYKSGDNVMDAINDVKIKLKKFRQSGLESGGEYSYENLTFKLLRRNGYIEKLLNLKKTIRVNQLSIKENQILQEFSDVDALRLEKKAIETYGETYNLNSVGYITPNGRLLNFSVMDRTRDVDHREIGYLIDELDIDYEQYGGEDWKYRNSAGLYVALDLGFIRYMPESKGFDMHKMPTQEQFKVLRYIIGKYDGEVIVDLDEKTSMEYDKGTPVDFIINGIKNYFRNGIKLKPYAYIMNDDNLYENIRKKKINK